MMGRFMTQFVLPIGWSIGMLCNVCACAEQAPEPLVDCYTPIDGGWQIRITGDSSVPRPEPGSRIGVVEDNPRLHRRPLYPPADKALLWDDAEREKMARYGFRPLVLAYNEPRFLFDFHSAGGLLGHLFIGLSLENGPGAWLHEWSEIDVRYCRGRMRYVLHDTAFPAVTVTLEALPLAQSVGLIVAFSLEGLATPASLTWAYGGASAFFTNYAMTAPEFNFAPEQCAKDQVQWEHCRFTLRRVFDKADSFTEQVFAVHRHLPDWEAVIRGGSSLKGRRGLGGPDAVAVSPVRLVESAQWVESVETLNCVAVEEVSLPRRSISGFIVVGMGRDIDKAIRKPANAWKNAVSRLDAITQRVITRTPDPYLDAAVPMMALATDGLWGDSTVMHGGWSWRFGYLGWRGWYGPVCYGWTDRIRRSIQNYVRLGLIAHGDDAGALCSLLDSPGGVFYNMNEVFLDHVRQYFEYTDDLELMRELFPVLVGIVEWENRRLRPGNEHLYENALNTWISDSHWYIQGQCTQASAYMRRANAFLGDLAERLAKDPTPYTEAAQRIRTAMQRTLWMPREGVFAEYRDTRGHQLLHTQPELPTIYHAAEFGAAGPLQVCQMLHWVETHLKPVTTPGGGKQFWSSNWFPNNGRSYTHSTYEMAYAEELNLALTYCLAGQADPAYAILRSTLCGIFNGPTPGGLSCHAYTDGRQRANDEFADAISMWGRTVIEGLFGIVPKRPDGRIELTPLFPSDWPAASINTPHFSYDFQRKPGEVRVEWAAPVASSVHLRLPLCAANVIGVSVNGKEADYRVEPGLGLTWVLVESPSAGKGRFVVTYRPASFPMPCEKTVKQGKPFQFSLPLAPLADFTDPQGLLANPDVTRGSLSGVIKGAPGPAMLFGSIGYPFCPVWVPIPLRIQAERPGPPPKVWSPPNPGKRALNKWTVIDLSNVFNATILEALEKVSGEAVPPPPPASRVGFGYWKSHLGARRHGDPVQVPSDAAWREKVGDDGIAWAADGIPFKTSKEGPNIGIVTLAGGYPAWLEFPVDATGKTLYLMLSGMSFPAQSHVTHLRVTLRYADAAEDSLELVSPRDIGDCWSTWCGRWHDAAGPCAHGFENLGGRFGPSGSCEINDMTAPVNVDTEARLLPIGLHPGRRLESVRIEAIANDIVFGIMGATILK